MHKSISRHTRFFRNSTSKRNQLDYNVILYSGRYPRTARDPYSRNLSLHERVYTLLTHSPYHCNSGSTTKHRLHCYQLPFMSINEHTPLLVPRDTQDDPANTSPFICNSSFCFMILIFTFGSVIGGYLLYVQGNYSSAAHQSINSNNLFLTTSPQAKNIPYHAPSSWSIAQNGDRVLHDPRDLHIRTRNCPWPTFSSHRLLMYRV